ncbi:MAG: cytochrome c biogenesis protein CcsA [Bacteroidetes bacterium]|nr:cytochrome c biogenesis protein CcsA [Bacteroidota bacterium]
MKNWWKILSILLLLFTIVWGFLGPVPHLAILHETIRNLYFHVTMWFGMMIILTVSLCYSILYLGRSDIKNDIIAVEAANVSVLLGTLGLVTGSLWARYTWGAWWTNDPQLNGAAVTMLAYLAYVLLRNSIDDEQKRARISAVYNIFAYVMMVVFIGIIPKFTGVDSLHPGKGGNPGFNSYDLDTSLRVVFYPAIVGWTLLAVWIMSLRIRIKNIQQILINK